MRRNSVRENSLAWVSRLKQTVALIVVAAVPVALYGATTQKDKKMQLTERLTKVGFILLGVSNLDRSAAFYRDRLGLPVQSESGGFVFLDAGGLSLGLSKVLGATRKPTAGAVELVFRVDAVQAMHEALEERGVTFTQAPRQVTAAEWAANFTDPDGHYLSIFGPPGDKSAATART